MAGHSRSKNGVVSLAYARPSTSYARDIGERSDAVLRTTMPGHDGASLESHMPDAFIYDHVRTPRGRGKADGALHEVTALNLPTQTLVALKARNKLDTTQVDDVVLGCVDPVGEAG